ncbi:MAG: MarR family transcriptional regulator [Pseudomonadales bacterium]|nr:MarR family transcriptional regulator [Pseudomonadales bacterium]
MRERFNGSAQTLGLTLAQTRALLHLARNEGASQVALARLLEVQPITLLKHIDRLAEKGLVRREPHPHDRRAQQLFLTDAATPLLEQMVALGADLTDSAVAGFSETERQALVHALQRVKHNLASDGGRDDH